MIWADWIGIGGILGLMGVAAGAFGAHALKHHLDAELLQVFEVAVRYQMYHALALIGIGFFSLRVESTTLSVAGWSFLAGVLIFSGSLYALALSGNRLLGAITPIGGVLLLVGWGSFVKAAFQVRFP